MHVFICPECDKEVGCCDPQAVLYCGHGKNDARKAVYMEPKR